MCVLSTQNESSCSSTARQSTHTSKSTFGMVEPGSGRIMSQDITEKPHFAARGGNRRIFGSVHAFSQPIVANQFYRLHTIIIWECRERMNMGNVGQAVWIRRYTPPEAPSGAILVAHLGGWWAVPLSVGACIPQLVAFHFLFALGGSSRFPVKPRILLFNSGPVSVRCRFVSFPSLFGT